MADNSNITVTQLNQKNIELEFKIQKLYNAVKIDKLKRKQEFENIENQIKKNSIILNEIQTSIDINNNEYSKQVELLKNEIKVENENLESNIMKSKEIFKLYNPNSPLNNSNQFRQLKELETSCIQFENQINDSSQIINSKTSHLNHLIQSIETKIKNHTNTIEEKERIKNNKIEMDLLNEELDKFGKSCGMTLNILDSSQMNGLINNLECNIKGSMPINIPINSMSRITGFSGNGSNIELVKANSFDSNNLHMKKNIDNINKSTLSTSLTSTPISTTTTSTTSTTSTSTTSTSTSTLTFSKSLTKEEIKSDIESTKTKQSLLNLSKSNINLKKQHSNSNAEQMLNSIQYPINIIISKRGGGIGGYESQQQPNEEEEEEEDNNDKIYKLYYSLEFDTIQTLTEKVYNYFQQQQQQQQQGSTTPINILKNIGINSIDDISFKTSCHFYFSSFNNKSNLKYIPFFSRDNNNNIGNTILEPVELYLVSKEMELKFYNEMSVIVGTHFSESDKNNTNEESINFRFRMTKFLDLINSTQLSCNNNNNSSNNNNNNSNSNSNKTTPTTTPTLSPTNSMSSLPLIGSYKLQNHLNNLEQQQQQQINISSNSSTPSTSPSYSTSPSINSLFKSIIIKSNNNNNNNNNEETILTTTTTNNWKSCLPTNKIKSSITNIISQLPSIPLLVKSNYSITQCTIRLFITDNIIKTFVCSLSTTISELYELIFKKYTKIISNEHPNISIENNQQSTSPSSFVLKLRNLEIYLSNNSSSSSSSLIRLSSIEFINSKSRMQKKIDLLLLLVKDCKNKRNEDYCIGNNVNNGNNGNNDDSIIFKHDEFIHGNSFPSNLSYGCNKKFRVRIGGLKNFELVKSNYSSILKSDSSRIYVVAQIYQCGFKIGSEMSTQKLPISSNPSWLYQLEGPTFKVIPSNAILNVKVMINDDILIGWGNYHIWNYKNKINSGFSSINLLSSITYPIVDPTNNDPSAGILNENELILSFEIDLSLQSILFTPEPIDFNQQIEFEKKYSSSSSSSSPDTSSSSTIDQLLIILKKDTLHELKKEEKIIVWKNRCYCKINYPNSISKIILSVPWNEPESVQELYWLLQNWCQLDPVDSLELLSSQFTDRQVRKLAISNVFKMNDSEITMYLPQLIQAIKHESHHYSILMKFILRRVLLNDSKGDQMGHLFFWTVKSEITQLETTNGNAVLWLERYSLLLESFLRGCTIDRLYEIYKQFEMYSKIKSLAIGVKSIGVNKRKEWLNNTLSQLLIMDSSSSSSLSFTTPISSEFRGRGIDGNQCKVKESKTNPLFLSIDNYDPRGDSNYIIFKAGDDLRLDQLVIQMINIMDKLWLADGLDLQTITYRIISTGQLEGIIEVVGDSTTIAEIQKQQGGISGAFNDTAITNWLKSENTSELEYNIAVENFIRSCAGCCVYSFILGLGDRHNDNIMITKDGHIFHIDFNKMLGNWQTWNGIRRERTPFVFPNSFANVIGPVAEINFKSFEELCCRAYNTIRNKANLFLNLFLMMVGGSITELSRKDDLFYLRDALALDLTNEQAATKFSNMIQESLISTSTNLNFAVHIAFN